MTTMSQPATDLPIVPPIVLADVEVRATSRLSPSFVRLVLGGPGLAEFGVEGPTWDQRIKLVVPTAGSELARAAELEMGEDGWYQAWLALPEERRGTMRTYTVRAVEGTGEDTVVIVDVVLHVEGDRHSALRLLRASKNRFGPSDEVGCFAMGDDGIGDVPDPSGLFLTPERRAAPGAAVTVTTDGRRVLPTEIQALVAGSGMPSPRRAVSGLDGSRVAMVMAVLERRCGIRLTCFATCCPIS